jgi:AmmeMemoRadiSam system protein A
MNPYVKLASDVVAQYVRTKNSQYMLPAYVTEEMQRRRAGTFVSIHTKDGALRGCIGTIGPTQPSLAMEIVANAISAATRDPRFTPIAVAELGNLEISVDVLTEPEKISSVSELNPKKYGVIVEKGKQRGLLLPDLEGIDTVEEQLQIAMRKAGILEGPYGCTLYRFQVVRHHA